MYSEFISKTQLLRELHSQTRSPRTIRHIAARNFLISSRSPLKSLPGLECVAYRQSSDSLREAGVGSTENFDLMVIGCGPAGEKAGAQAAYFGKRVAMIERAQHVGAVASILVPFPAKLCANRRSISQA